MSTVIASKSGKRVKEYRKSKEWSQQQLADLLGVSRSYLGDIEAGRSEPSTNFLTAITTKTDASSDWILTGEGKMQKGKTTEPQTATEVDSNRLFLAIETVEEGLQETHRTMEPDKKAHLVMAVYELFEDQTPAIKQSVLRLVKSAA
jgi:transcriptional regulator with XRE-family HTH domain